MSDQSWWVHPCGELSGLSSYVANWMREQPRVGEESITDWFLYRCSAQIPRFLYRKFNRWEEGTNFGADWDWWIITDTGAIAMRIQAKKLTLGDDHYPGLARANAHGLQAEMLLSSSERDNLLAFYALYFPADVLTTACRQRRNAGQGTFLRGAQSIYATFIVNGRRRVDAHQLLDGSTPMSCLFCCPLAGDGSTLATHLTAYHPDAMAATTAGGRRGIHESLPPHIQALFPERSPAGFPTWWDAEFGYLADATNALAVLDLRSVEGSAPGTAD